MKFRERVENLHKKITTLRKKSVWFDMGCSPVRAWKLRKEEPLKSAIVLVLQVAAIIFVPLLWLILSIIFFVVLFMGQCPKCKSFNFETLSREYAGSFTTTHTEEREAGKIYGTNRYGGIDKSKTVGVYTQQVEVEKEHKVFKHTCHCKDCDAVFTRNLLW